MTQNNTLSLLKGNSWCFNGNKLKIEHIELRVLSHTFKSKEGVIDVKIWSRRTIFHLVWTVAKENKLGLTWPRHINPSALEKISVCNLQDGFRMGSQISPGHRHRRPSGTDGRGAQHHGRLLGSALQPHRRPADRLPHQDHLVHARLHPRHHHRRRADGQQTLRLLHKGT